MSRFPNQTLKFGPTRRVGIEFFFDKTDQLGGEKEKPSW